VFPAGYDLIRNRSRKPAISSAEGPEAASVNPSMPALGGNPPFDEQPGPSPGRSAIAKPNQMKASIPRTGIGNVEWLLGLEHLPSRAAYIEYIQKKDNHVPGLSWPRSPFFAEPISREDEWNPSMGDVPTNVIRRKPIRRASPPIERRDMSKVNHSHLSDLTSTYITFRVFYNVHTFRTIFKTNITLRSNGALSTIKPRISGTEKLGHPREWLILRRNL